MQKRRKRRSSPIGFIMGLGIGVLAAGGSAAWWAIHSLNASKIPTAEISSQGNNGNPQEQTSPTPTTAKPVKSPVSEQPSLAKQAKVYWLSSKGSKIELDSSPVVVSKSADKGEILQTALEQLLAGPTESNYTTTIPQGTKLLGVTLEKGGVRLNLSQDFTTGGGSEAMTGRVAQILYTATSINPHSKVWLDIEGKPLEELGGEGLMLEQPITRQWFKKNFDF